METTANKQYKNLGNTIRDSVFRAKEAPTMLPDETIEKLGLGEDDVLSMEEEQLDEVGASTGKDQRSQAEELATKLARNITNIRVPSTDSVAYEPGSPGADRAYKKDTIKVKKDLAKLISQLEAITKTVNKLT